MLGNSVFCRLGAKNLEVLAASKSEVHYDQGEVILAEGEIPSGVFCLYKGTAGINRQTSDHQIVQYTLHPGRLIGYRSVLNKRPYPLSVISLTNTSLCFIPRRVFNRLAESEKQLARELIFLLTEDLKQAENAIIRMAKRPVTERLAEAMMISLHNSGDFHLGYWEQFAPITGTTPEIVHHVLIDLDEKGILSLENDRIIVLDPDALEQIALGNLPFH